MSKNLKHEFTFHNEVINKKKLQKLMYLTFHNYGVIKSSLIADKIKNLTFHYATLSGISLSVEDLRVPSRKRSLIGLTNNEVELTEKNFGSGNITVVERFQKVIDIWNNANNTLKDEVLTYFRESDPLNPLFIMAFSGARGNISQVRQLVGMRGLMADPQGQIIDLPIKSNFREGLKVTEYIISSYGARKGQVDTALRTADSGYLTRRLVDVAQDIIVREEDCLTTEGLSLEDLFTTYKTELSLEDRLVGRLLSEPLIVPDEDKIFPANTEIDLNLVSLISKYKITSVKVRSPLTCNALRSICRKCYGWHLSYSRIIDLGEAIGILAAQSIGEPGTQLTMRTFHTGGVFSGDSTKQIRAPFSGTLNYSLKSNTSLVRTLHGEKGFNLMEAVTLTIEDLKGTICSLDIPRGAMLLVNNNQKVYPNQVVAEIKKEANLILEEDKRDIYTQVSGEIFFQNVKLEDQTTVEDEIFSKKISKTNGLIWILYGDRYTLQAQSAMAVRLGQKFKTNQTLASKTFVNKYSGIVSFDDVHSKGAVNIINSSMVLDNAIVFKNKDEHPVLELKTSAGKSCFKLHVKNNDLVTHGQTLASLVEEEYKTESGGILFYSTYNPLNKRKRGIKKNFRGSLYWIPEETHFVNSGDVQNLSVQNGSFVKKGTQVLPNVFTNLCGFLQLNSTNTEIIIKPGELYKTDTFLIREKDKVNQFLYPGDVLFSNIFIQKLSYIEFINISGVEYVLIRPVKTYVLTQDKGFFLNYRFFPNTKSRSVAFRTVKRIFYKDGERVKFAKGGVDLLKTFLVLDIKNTLPGLISKLELVPFKGLPNKYHLKYSSYEELKIDNFYSTDNKLKNKTYLKYLIKNYQYVTAKTSIVKLEILSNMGGTLVSINKTNTIDLLVLKNSSIKKCSYNPQKETPCVKLGDLVRAGTYLTSTIRSKYAGQIYKITGDQIIIRLGRPYLISAGTILRALPRTLVEKSDILATLVYEKLKTVDIVQGLPKVEEILEARKIKNGCLLSPDEGRAYMKNEKIEIIKSPGNRLLVDIDPQLKVNFSNGKYVNFLEPLTDGPISPHDKLETLFSYYQKNYPVHEACKRSFKHLQLFLVNEVQRTYLSQGVQIADKHIEIIVKQMTSKVRVIYGGDTTLLPGEILDINQAERITKATILVGEDPPVYKPMLLGLTKASLNSDSFISAASFQETTRVLTEAAIEGKKDWLNGLKENVIIGRLIPAGTGFNCFENLKKVGRETLTKHLIKPNQTRKLKTHILKARLK